VERIDILIVIGFALELLKRAAVEERRRAALVARR
jgi:hypothetical protein